MVATLAQIAVLIAYRLYNTTVSVQVPGLLSLAAVAAVSTHEHPFTFKQLTSLSSCKSVYA